MHRLRLFAQQDSSMRHAGHMSTVCSWCAIVSRPACNRVFTNVSARVRGQRSKFIRSSMYTATGCKEDARWSCGRRSTSIRPTAAGHRRTHRHYTYRRHTYSACAPTRASAARAARCSRLGHAPAARLRPSAAPSPHARRCGAPSRPPSAAPRTARRRPRDEPPPPPIWAERF